jgi:hypothetical protein
MPNIAPLGEAVTVLMTVNSSSRIALFSGGEKIADQAVGNVTPLTVATLRFGSTEPNGFNPGTFLMEQISGWSIPMSDLDASLVSSNLDANPLSVAAPKPVVSIPTALSVQEGGTLQIPITKQGAGACTVQLRTVAVVAISPADYTGFQQTVTFGVNDSVINVPLATILDADSAEPDEILRVQLSLADSADCTLGNANAVITIT